MKVIPHVDSDGYIHFCCVNSSCQSVYRVKSAQKTFRISCSNCSYPIIVNLDQGNPLNPSMQISRDDLPIYLKPEYSYCDKGNFFPKMEAKKQQEKQQWQKNVPNTQQQQSNSIQGTNRTYIWDVVRKSCIGLLIVGFVGLVIHNRTVSSNPIPLTEGIPVVETTSSKSETKEQVTKIQEIQEQVVAVAKKKKEVVPTDPSKTTQIPSKKNVEPTKQQPEELAKEPSQESPKSSANAKPLKKEDPITTAQKATALVEGKESVGSGFLIRNNILVTNAHVIDGELIDNIRIRFVSLDVTRPRPLSAQLIYKDRSRDLALLRIEVDQTPLLLPEEKTSFHDLDIAIIGNPIQSGGQLKLNSVGTGKLKDAVLLDGEIFYQLDSKAAPGNSGGPVICTKTGKVVGVLTSIINNTNTSFCIPSTEVRIALKRFLDGSVDKDYQDKVSAWHYLDYCEDKLVNLEILVTIALKGQQVRKEDLWYNTYYFFNGQRKSELLVNNKKIDIQDLLSQFREAHKEDIKMIDLYKEKYFNPSNTKFFQGSFREIIKSRIDSYKALKHLVDNPDRNPETYKRKVDAALTKHTKIVDTYRTAYKKDFQTWVDKLDR